VAHIDLDPGQPGILALFQFRPETAAALTGLGKALLRGPGPLPLGDRAHRGVRVPPQCVRVLRAVARGHGRRAAAGRDGRGKRGAG
jgi:hypothetical protein